jgi:hypothetical protein
MAMTCVFCGGEYDANNFVCTSHGTFCSVPCADDFESGLAEAPVEEPDYDGWDAHLDGEFHQEPDGDREPDIDPVWADADALASAGWGTDEDYGCFSGDDF